MGVGFDDGEEVAGGVGERGLAAVDEAELALHLELWDGDGGEGTGGELIFYGEAGNQGDAVAAFDEALDGFEGGEFDLHLQRRAVALKGGDDLLAHG